MATIDDMIGKLGLGSKAPNSSEPQPKNAENATTGRSAAQRASAARRARERAARLRKARSRKR